MHVAAGQDTQSDGGDCEHQIAAESASYRAKYGPVHRRRCYRGASKDRPTRGSSPSISGTATDV
jgi:hypothetical protein